MNMNNCFHTAFNNDRSMAGIVINKQTFKSPNSRILTETHFSYYINNYIGYLTKIH